MEFGLFPMTPTATPQLVNDNRRYHGLDALRAMAMMLGVVLHVALYFQESNPDEIWPVRDVERSALAGFLSIMIHVFRMPLFFVMAGFFAAMMHRKRGSAGFIGNRFFRIAVPLIVGWLILYPLVKAAFGFAFIHAEGLDISTSLGMAIGGMVSEGPWSDPHPIHLWFLYYLLILYVCLLTAGLMLRLIPPLGRTWERCAEICTRSPLRLPILIAVTFGLLCMMEGPGVDTPSDFIPRPRILIYYGLYMIVGWAMWNNRRVIEELHRGCWLRFLAGFLLLLVTVFLTIAYYMQQTESGWTSKNHLLFYVTQASVAITNWLLILGAIGIAERIMRRHHPIIRYLVDASYWIYLAHLPLSVFIPALFRNWQINGTLKMFIMMILVTIPLLLTWQLIMGIVPSRRTNGIAASPK